LEASHLGKDDGVHAVRKSPREDVDAPLQPGGEAEKEQAVRLVRKLRDELGTEHGTIGRVARQLGYGEESVRSHYQRVLDGFSTITSVTIIVINLNHE